MGLLFCLQFKQKKSNENSEDYLIRVNRQPVPKDYVLKENDRVTVTPTGLQADAITIHHGVNDHQAFGKAAQSSPVQSYHPHGVTFDVDGCIVGLDSPKADFKVQHNTVTLESENSYDFAATGTVGPRAECTATGLGITNLYDTEE